MDEVSPLKTKDMEKTFCHLLLEVTDSTAFIDGSQALIACPSDKSGININIGMEHW
jgi:hypothetical protein